MSAVRFEGQGVMLAADVAGHAGAPPILFMHGGGQTRHSWGRAVSLAAERGFRSISIDLRGHGESDWAPDGRYELDDYAADARAVIAQLGGCAAIVGASLGGLTGLIVSGESSGLTSALVLVDVAPRIEIEGAAEIRGFMSSAPNGFASVEEAADAVSAYLPHRPRPTNTDGLMKNLRRDEDGRYRWHWDPAMTKPGDGPRTGKIQERLERAARNLTVPALLVRGGISRVVSQQSVDEFLALAPHAEYVNVTGADHMVAGDRNDAFNEAVFSFLERQR
jgi:pimeloyl-ACP methyl ester carboxylesterase